MGERNVVKFKDIVKISNPFDIDETYKIDEYINKTVYIGDFKVVQGNNFDVVYMLVYDPELKREVVVTTTSKVIASQLERIREVLDEGKMVEATVRKRKRYYCLE